MQGGLSADALAAYVLMHCTKFHLMIAANRFWHLSAKWHCREASDSLCADALHQV